MTNIVKNRLELTMNSEDTVEQAWRIYEKRVHPVERGEISDLFDKGTQTHIFRARFESGWSPPFGMFIELKALKGVYSIEATWVDEGDDYDIRYQWVGEDREFKVIEKGLTRPENETGLTF